ncbi:hypothetical protein [Acinetobacter baylyi]|uniref:hypothetical protein n=1 Tax=Acinetobacter baylyi TaxID=202950 RepID=UPI000EA0E203|nr:hypothetical protein [Acinetobacter baylyi]
MLTLGKDYNYVINELDFPRVSALNAYHKQYPPAEVGIQRLCRILEAFMGIEDSHSFDDRESDDDDIMDDLMNFPQG